jgi:hypothetical protein
MRLALRFDSRKPGTFEVIGAMLDVRAKLLFHLVRDLRTREELGLQANESRRELSYFLRGGGKRRGNRFGKTVPPFSFLSQTLAARRSEFVELRSTIVL